MSNLQDFFDFAFFSSGERGIRTPGTSQFNGFQDRRNRPLCHLSLTSFEVCTLFQMRCKDRYIFLLSDFSLVFFLLFILLFFFIDLNGWW